MQEQVVFEFCAQHLKQHHVLPQLETLYSTFPEMAGIETIEPPSFYVKQLENRYFYERINKANLESQELLKQNQDAHAAAVEVMRRAVNEITEQQYRLRILNVGKELPGFIMSTYHNAAMTEAVAKFGWPHMDEQGGAVMPGEVVSFVGRPALGKTWLMLWTAMHNWRQCKQNVMFVSMEMGTLQIGQRIAAMYTGCNIGQLKTSGYSHVTLKKFAAGLKAMTDEQASFYVIDGNLAACVDDIYAAAEMLECKIVVIDGAYLLKHRNPRLDRFQRVAQNVEDMKQIGSDLGTVTFCSWQLNREAEKKKKDGKEIGVGEIGYSDAIGQISSIVLGLFQEDSPETVQSRKITVMKGRNGEIGELSIAWNFINMDFGQVDPPIKSTALQNAEVQWL
jgi:replicative DNA helicase